MLHVFSTLTWRLSRRGAKNQGAKMAKETPKIEIDDDIPCPKCGKPGATQGGTGICLNCAAKYLRGSK